MSSVYLTPSDSSILDGCSLYCYYAKKYLQIQFPPKITSDTRKMSWNEHKSGFGLDPTANYAGNSGREISIKFEYIVETDQDVLHLWSVTRIKNNINLLKGIFTGFRFKLDEKFNPETLNKNGQVLVLFKYPLHLGFGAKTFRVTSVGVEYSDEIISGLVTSAAPSSSKSAGSTIEIVSYPLKSTVTMNMATYGLGEGKTPSTTWEQASATPTFDELWY